MALTWLHVQILIAFSNSDEAVRPRATENVTVMRSLIWCHRCINIVARLPCDEWSRVPWSAHQTQKIAFPARLSWADRVSRYASNHSWVERGPPSKQDIGKNALRVQWNQTSDWLYARWEEGELHSQPCKGPDQELLLLRRLWVDGKSRKWKCYKRRCTLWVAAPF